MLSYAKVMTLSSISLHFGYITLLSKCIDTKPANRVFLLLKTCSSFNLLFFTVRLQNSLSFHLIIKWLVETTINHLLMDPRSQSQNHNRFLNLFESWSFAKNALFTQAQIYTYHFCLGCNSLYILQNIRFVFPSHTMFFH